MFNSIVVGSDGSPRSEQALAAAVELARLHGATLHVVQAFRSALQTAAMAGDAMVGMAATTDAEIQAQIEQELGRLVADIQNDGLVVRTYASPQPAPNAILSVAAQQRADLIVVGNKGMRGARRVLGSVPNSIAHQATCAVMIVPTG